MPEACPNFTFLIWEWLALALYRISSAQNTAPGEHGSSCTQPALLQGTLMGAAGSPCETLGSRNLANSTPGLCKVTQTPQVLLQPNEGRQDMRMPTPSASFLFSPTKTFWSRQRLLAQLISIQISIPLHHTCMHKHRCSLSSPLIFP